MSEDRLPGETITAFRKRTVPGYAERQRAKRRSGNKTPNRIAREASKRTESRIRRRADGTIKRTHGRYVGAEHE